MSQFDAYPVPRVDKLLEWLGMAQFFRALVFTKAYWKIPLSVESKEKTFFTPYGLYQFITLLFGALATFQRLVDHVLWPHTAYAAAYLDDVIIHCNTWAEHVRVNARERVSVCVHVFVTNLLNNEGGKPFFTRLSKLRRSTGF